MDLDTITMAQDEAHARYLEYRDQGDTDEDREIARGYRALARGDTIIHLADTIAAGGVDDQGRPRLAVMQADLRWCYLRRETDGSVEFKLEPWPDGRRRRGIYRFGPGTLPRAERPKQQWNVWSGVRAMVPIVPPALRPGPHLRNYDILWEVDEWATAPRPPGDPALLKHLGGQLYTVLATWDLTPLEQAVLAGRLV